MIGALFYLFFLFLSKETSVLKLRFVIPKPLPPEKSVCKKQLLKLYMEQQTCSTSGKKYVKAIYCQPDYLTYMQSTSWEMLGWMKHKLESRSPGEYQ